MEDSYQTIDMREKKSVSLSLPTLALGAVAVAASTASAVLCLAGSQGQQEAVSVPKFVSPNHHVHAQRNAHVAAAGKKPSSGGSAEKEMVYIPRDPSQGSIYVQPEAQAPEGFGESAGVLPPVGYLDPLGFGAAATPERLRWFREAELKHGRIAMLASLGFLVGENTDILFPGKAPAYASAALTEGKLNEFWLGFVGGIGALEIKFFEKFKDPLGWKLADDYEVGDLGFDPLGLKPTDEDTFAEKRTKELQNGRLAMLAIAGFNAQEMTDGKKIFPLHGLPIDAASADEWRQNLQDGLELVKEMSQMLAETAPKH